MSRAIFLDMSEKSVIAHCEAEKIGISCIGKVPMGGTRLVCMSVDGAAQIRHQLKAKLMKSDVAREQHGPGWGFVPRS
ncbi:MAG TPA: hypothetical protein VJ775_05355 [Sphingomicrobium sp.]|jgi:hypothetical protein|nr:hypothetical protein [Sphingomicrobium sp.]